jgi:hypothetical protein
MVEVSSETLTVSKETKITFYKGIQNVKKAFTTHQFKNLV